MTTHFEASYKFGKANEEIILPLIQAKFNSNIKPYTDKWSKFDFFDEITDYELKSRTFHYSKYSTTMITANKVYGDREKVFIFSFTDGVYFIKYNKEKFDKYEKINFARSGILIDMKPHFLIPIEELIRL